MACTPAEIDDKPLGRTVCNEAIVFYRGAEGAVATLEDFCPHRGAPLSLGRVIEGQLVCGYHGLVMGCDGKTIAMPGQRVRGFAPIRAYPVVERHGFIWVWPGDAALADPDQIHHCPWADNPDWAYGGGLFHIDCDYRLMVDNLMDLSHETYVHASSIGQREIDETPSTTRTEGDQVTTSRFMNAPRPAKADRPPRGSSKVAKPHLLESGIEAPPFWQMALRGNHLPDDQLVDRWQICHFSPPSHVLIEVGVALAGQGGYHADAKVKAASIVVDFITPERKGSIWYFWGMARNFNARDKALTATLREGQAKIFSEDLELLERQQKNLGAWPDRQLLKLNIDAGGVQARRVLDRLIAAERAASASAAPATAAVATPAEG